MPAARHDLCGTLKVTLRLIVFEVDRIPAPKSVKDIKEQDVYMGTCRS